MNGMMSKYPWRAILGLAAVSFAALLTGCTSIHVHANKDPEAVRKVRRLSILIHHGDTGEQIYSKDLSAALHTAFTNTAVSVDVDIAGPAELDDKGHQRRRAEFQCDSVLVITATGGVVNGYGGYPTIIYDMSLYEPKLDKRLWRARVDNSGGTALIELRMRKMAERLVQQLRDDGFL
jgi:hypothetical protein